MKFTGKQSNVIVLYLLKISLSMVYSFLDMMEYVSVALEMPRSDSTDGS